MLRNVLKALAVAGLWLGVLDTARALEPTPAEAEYYPLVTLPIPDGVVLEAGALDMSPEGKLAVATRRGEIYLITNPLSEDPSEVKYERFAHGLHEVLGLAYRDGWLYATQRGELSRLKDTNQDGRADLFETVSDLWDINGDYHEYAFGSKFDRDGNIWVALCLTGSFSSENKYRGWCFRISPEGKAIPTSSGIRSPGGLGMNPAGDMFYTENQGPWNGACSLKHLKPGAFLGHPAGLRWHEAAGMAGARPKEPESGSRMAIEVKKIPELLAPAVYFPYPKMGQSASGITSDLSGGKFGPFAGQMFVGDQAASTVMRVVLEKVDGRYQGACLPFRKDFASGCLPLLMTREGTLFVGGTSRGWGSRGGQPFSLQRLAWNGKVPFEIHEIHARSDGFELSFTSPVDRASAADPRSYGLTTYTYIYQATYGSPEVDTTTSSIDRIEVSEDGKVIRLSVPKLQVGHVHELHLDGVRSLNGRPLLHPEAYYTLNAIPGT